MIAAHSAAENPPTPVPSAGNATDSRPRSSASVSALSVAARILSASVRRSCPMAAAWITWRAVSVPPPVTTAPPTSIGPWRIASASISAPPARTMAPATPAPIQRWLLAALTIASTS